MGFYLLGRLIPWYGFFIALGIILASFLSYVLCKKTQKDYNDFIILAAWLMAAGFLGAKLFFILIYFKVINWAFCFSSLKNFSVFIGTGFIFYGGLIGGFLVLPLIQKIHKIQIKKYINILCPAVALCHAFGRIGCSFAGCCHGRITEGPLYFVYKESLSAPNGVHLFPVQGIEAFCVFVLALIFTLLVLKNIKFSLLNIYLLSYSVLRFILEFFRGDEARGFLGNLSTSQIISFFIFALGLTGMILQIKTSRDKINYDDCHLR